jgi:Glycosyl transferase family 90
MKLANHPCPDLPSAVLLPTEMPWLAIADQKCTYAYWIHQLLLGESHQRCSVEKKDEEEEDPRCPLIRDITAQTTDETEQKELLLQRYLSALSTHDTTLIPCLATCRPNEVMYVKVLSDWGLPLDRIFPHGLFQRSIRLTRRNYFERYMAFVMAVKTNIWSVNNADDKIQQVAAFNDFTLNMGEMISFFDKFVRDDANADVVVRTQFQTTLWIDHQDVRDRPAVVQEALKKFLSGTPIDATTTTTTSDQQPDGATTTTAWPRGKDFHQKLANRDTVGGMLSTAGRADWIGRPNQRPIYLLLLDSVNQRPYDLPPGVHATRVATLELLQFHLQLLQPDDLVVVSDYHTTVNPHIRTNPHWYGALARFRSRLEEHHRGKVVLTSASADPTRDVRSASRLLAAHGGLTLAGPAGSVLEILLYGDTANGEVETVADDRSMFGYGQRFEGVMDKMGCHNVGSHTIATVSDRPLFVSGMQTNCFRQPVRFPVWGDLNNETIATEPILAHIDRHFTKNESLAYIDRHFGNEIIYHVNATGVFGGPVLRDQYRVLPTEELLVKAHDILIEEQKTGRITTSQWPALQKSMSSSNGGKGFTYFGWYGDWKGCNLHNAPDQQTVPILTTCATMSCNYSFPSPAYMTIVNAQPDMTHWLTVFDEFEDRFPWEKKISQVYWRGALTENDPLRVYESARWRLNKQIHEITDEATKKMFDVGFTGFPIFLTAQMTLDETVVGGFKQGMTSMNDFQHYKAILDMDGNSWSSRFSTMLCYNSLAIKVEPEYADHFFFDLVPWKHYVPVKNDLSDLIDNVQFVLDPVNDGIIRNMIGAANQWCMQRLTKQALVLDQLDVWNAYVERLDGPSTVPGPENTEFANRMVRLPIA